MKSGDKAGITLCAIELLKSLGVKEFWFKPHLWFSFKYYHFIRVEKVNAVSVLSVNVVKSGHSYEITNHLTLAFHSEPSKLTFALRNKRKCEATSSTIC